MSSNEPLMYIIVSAEDYRELIQSNPLVLVEFKAKWCHSSNMIAPFCHLLAEKYASLKFANLDVDFFGVKNLEKLDLNLNLGAIPAFYLYKNGELLDKLVSGSHVKLQTFIESYYQGEINKTSNTNYETVSFALKKNEPYSSESAPVWNSVRPKITRPPPSSPSKRRTKSAKPKDNSNNNINNTSFRPNTAINKNNNNSLLAVNQINQTKVARSQTLIYGRHNTT